LRADVRPQNSPFSSVRRRQTSEQSAPAGWLSGAQAAGASNRWIAALPDMSHFAAEFLQKLRRSGLRASYVR
jgi:hypothetical protein